MNKRSKVGNIKGRSDRRFKGVSNIFKKLNKFGIIKKKK